MKRVIFTCIGFFCAIRLVAQPVTVPTLGPRYKQTRERAEILFGHRNGDYPLPDFRMPLFQTASGPVATPGDETGKGDESDEARLAEAVAVLKKGSVGTMTTAAGRSVLTVGAKPYKEGDRIAVPMRGSVTFVRITRIGGNSVSLSLNDSEAVLSFSAERGQKTKSPPE